MRLKNHTFNQTDLSKVDKVQDILHQLHANENGTVVVGDNHGDETEVAGSDVQEVGEAGENAEEEASSESSEESSSQGAAKKAKEPKKNKETSASGSSSSGSSSSESSDDDDDDAKEKPGAAKPATASSDSENDEEGYDSDSTGSATPEPAATIKKRSGPVPVRGYILSLMLISSDAAEADGRLARVNYLVDSAFLRTRGPSSQPSFSPRAASC